MEDKGRSADSFGTFLKIVQGKGEPASTDPPIRLLLTLDESKTLASDVLWDRTGLDITTFGAALKAVKDSGFVTTDEDRVTITESGANVAASARAGT